MHIFRLFSLCALLAIANSIPNGFTCYFHWFKQPLTHFERVSDHFYQRTLICKPDFNFVKENEIKQNVILFYCGNESPLELYINNTGLMYEFSRFKNVNALLVFAEHRFFGLSITSKMSKNFEFLSSKEAIEDYHLLINQIYETFGLNQLDWPVITFGGSYGGMLSVWFKFRYPNQILGSVASSAPIAGFPFNQNVNVDDATALIKRNIDHYSSFATDNLLISWILISELSKNNDGIKVLNDIFNFCKEDDFNLLSFLQKLQNVFFLYSEGNYNFATNYITFSTSNSSKNLPRKPLKKVISFIDKDYKIKLVGYNSNLVFKVESEAFVIDVQLNETKLSSGNRTLFLKHDGMKQLLFDVAKGFQLINDNSCISFKTKMKVVDQLWSEIVCNDGVNFVPLLAQGLGNDFVWPPSHSPNVSKEEMVKRGLDFCFEKSRFHSKDDLDPKSHFIERYYGGSMLAKTVENVIFTVKSSF